MNKYALLKSLALAYIYEKIRGYAEYIYMPYLSKAVYKAITYLSRQSKNKLFNAYERFFKTTLDPNFEDSYEFISKIIGNMAAQELILQCANSQFSEKKYSGFGRIIGAAYLIKVRPLGIGIPSEPVFKHVNKCINLLPPKASSWLLENSEYIVRENALHIGYCCTALVGTYADLCLQEMRRAIGAAEKAIRSCKYKSTTNVSPAERAKNSMLALWTIYNSAEAVNATPPFSLFNEYANMIANLNKTSHITKWFVLILCVRLRLRERTKEQLRESVICFVTNRSILPRHPCIFTV